MHPLAPTEVSVWKHATSTLGLAPVRWVPTTIRFSPVRCLVTALGFSPVSCILTALGFSPIRCEREACCPLVASFLFVIVKAEPYRECLGLQWASLFAYVFMPCRSTSSWFWLLWDLRVQTLSHMHQSSLHLLHSSPSRVYISFHIWQSPCMFLYFVVGTVLVILSLFLNLFVDWSWSSRHLLTCSHRFSGSTA